MLITQLEWVAGSCLRLCKVQHLCKRTMQRKVALRLLLIVTDILFWFFLHFAILSISIVVPHQ